MGYIKKRIKKIENGIKAIFLSKDENILKNLIKYILEI